MILRERLESLPHDPILIASPAGDVTKSDILNADLDVRRLTGARAALYISDPRAALLVLSALDGTAEAIAMLSPAAPPELVARLAARGGFEAILCDTPEVFDGIEEAAPAYRDIETLASSLVPREAPEETRWILSTSGTTDEPKLISHTLASLTRTTKVDHARGSRTRWGMLYDYTRFAGLQVLFQSVLSGSILIAPNFEDSLDRKLEFFVERGCTCLSGTPTLWRKILMTPGAEKLKLRQATLGGEIVDDRILSAVAAFYPQARVTHIFAATEPGVGFSVSDKRAGFPLNYLTNPPAGIGVKVENGQLYIRNEHVRGCYLGTDVYFASDDGWVATGDAVAIKGDRVMFLGRSSGVINVGGEKVHPEEVENALLAHPLVAAARVYAKSNPITGSLVAADVTLKNPVIDLLAARETLRAYTLKTLQRHKAPTIIKIVSDFELNAAGKLLRK